MEENKEFEEKKPQDTEESGTENNIETQEYEIPEKADYEAEIIDIIRGNRTWLC